MVEQQKQPEVKLTSAPRLEVKSDQTVVAQPEKLSVPKEMFSMNKGVSIINDNGNITIEFAPVIAEEIGSYRRCPVKIKFKENGPVQVIPDIK